MKNLLINRALVAKKKLSILFLAFVASAGTMFAWNYNRVKIDNLYYYLDETNLIAEVASNEEASGHVTIPETVVYSGNIYTVTSIKEGAFSRCSGLTSVTIPNSVTSIGNNVFYDCTGLTSPVYNAHIFAYLPTSYSGAYVIPDGIESIAGTAFRLCTGLTSVTIPNSVTSIGSVAFGECTSLTSVTIPNSVTSIGAYVCYGCTSLTSPVYNAHVFVYLPTSYSGAYVIPDGIESIAGSAFYKCTNLTSVTIPNSVTSFGQDPFSNCTAMTSVTMKSVAPPTLRDETFEDCKTLNAIYVPCGSLEVYQRAEKWQRYASIIKYKPLPYTIITKIAGYGHVDVPQYMCVCDTVQVSAIPDRGCYFTHWADGNTENPRTIELTQDTTMEAVFDYQLIGKCGKDSALTWSLDTMTMALNITGKGALSEIYTYGTFIESLTIGNEVTSIGQSAFYGFNNLKNVIIGSSVKVLESDAFAGCSSIKTITCYSQRPAIVNGGALGGLDYSTIVYVPADYLNTYKMHDAWGLYDVRPLGASSIETNEVQVKPAETTATVAWPAVSGAASYELVIKDKSGNIICTLIFNANGQLNSIAFNAPSRDKAPQQTQTAGFSFTVTGLEEGHSYDLTLTSKDSSGATIDEQVISFTTGGEQALDQITSGKGQMTSKIIKDNQIFILRGEKIYTLQGQEVR